MPHLPQLGIRGAWWGGLTISSLINIIDSLRAKCVSMRVACTLVHCGGGLPTGIVRGAARDYYNIVASFVIWHIQFPVVLRIAPNVCRDQGSPLRHIHQWSQIGLRGKLFVAGMHVATS